MGDLIFILLPVIIVAGILLIVVPIAAEIKNKSSGGSQQKHQKGKNEFVLLRGFIYYINDIFFILHYIIRKWLIVIGKVENVKVF